MPRWPEPPHCLRLPTAADTRRLALTLGAALLAAWLCEALRVPLPWMIGPLLATAGAAVAGLPVRASSRLRNAGQGLIGVALGLYFTPPVVALMVTLAPAVALGALWALLLGYLFYRLLLRAGGPGIDKPTAFFSAAIGGASEMAVLAERHDGRVDRVAAAHSLRVLMVVLLIPVAYQLAGVHGADPTLPAVREVQPAGLALLLMGAAAGVWLLQRVGTPNPFVLGALLVVAALTACGITPSALPRWASNGAQLVIGVALGARFSPEFVHAAPRWLGCVAAGTLAMIVASVAYAWAVAQWVQLHPATVLLASAPGGIAEMCITAKVLQLGVPVVTVFHIVRYLAVLLLTAPLYRWERRRG